MNAYEQKLREDLKRILGEHTGVDCDDLVDQLATFVSKETRKSFLNGLRGQKGRPGKDDRRPKAGAAA